MNDMLMPVLLAMITKEEAFKLLTKKTQILIKALVIINTIVSLKKLVTNTLKVFKNLES